MRKQSKPGGFSKVTGSNRKRIYGERRVLVCGYTVLDQDALLVMMERFNFQDVGVVFAGAADMDRTLGDILKEPTGYGRGEDSLLPRAVVLSGVTEKELNTFMAAWKHLELPAQNWAALTPTSETWSLMDLLAELDMERIAMQSMAK